MRRGVGSRQWAHVEPTASQLHAGIAADLRTFAACGVHGCIAVTAVRVQNSMGVTSMHLIPPETVAAQIESVATNIRLDVVKTGMLANSAIIEAIAVVCERLGIGAEGPIPLVVDPVAASMHGDQLADEVRLLIGIEVHDRAAQYEAARLLHALGPRYVLVKGGHLRADVDSCVDLLYDGKTFTELPGPRFDTGNTHGSGESIGATIASGLARGMAMPDAVALGKRYIVEAVRHSYPL